MYKIFFTITLTTLLGFFALANVSGDEKQSVTADFAAKLCIAWNNSKLPSKLGAELKGGSGWIDVVTDVAIVPPGTQIIASGRNDCSKNPEFIITLQI